MRRVIAASFGLVVVASDPTCWADASVGYTRQQCCGRKEVDEKGCWDDSYTWERCCERPEANFAEEPEMKFLTLSQSMKAAATASAKRCWPRAVGRTEDSNSVFLSTFNTCCGLRQGLKGKASCFPNSIRASADNLSLATARAPVGAWSVDDVCRWLGDSGLSDHEAEFRREDVDGLALQDLDNEDLRELGLTIGRRKHFLRQRGELLAAASTDGTAVQGANFDGASTDGTEVEGASFDTCCLPTLVEGLDMCEEGTDAAKWCIPGSWSPVPVLGLRKGILDHRMYIGSAMRRWDVAGQAALAFLTHPKGGNIKPSTHLLDLACGPLRLGRYLIPWLDADRYVGFDKARLLIEQGYWYELTPEDRSGKRPRFAASADFDFSLLGQPFPNVTIAVSLLSHLNISDTRNLLTKLRNAALVGHTFFATYVPNKAGISNPAESDSHASFRYAEEELAEVATQAGWQVSGATDDVWQKEVARVGKDDKHRQARHVMLRFTSCGSRSCR